MKPQDATELVRLIRGKADPVDIARERQRLERRAVAEEVSTKGLRGNALRERLAQKKGIDDVLS